jgi:hypothetical protein
VDPDGDDVPARQFKHVASVVPAVVVEYLPTEQLVQTDEPVTVENFPGGHC